MFRGHGFPRGGPIGRQASFEEDEHRLAPECPRIRKALFWLLASICIDDSPLFGSCGWPIQAK